MYDNSSTSSLSTPVTNPHDHIAKDNELDEIELRRKRRRLLLESLQENTSDSSSVNSSNSKPTETASRNENSPNKSISSSPVSQNAPSSIKTILRNNNATPTETHAKKDEDESDSDDMFADSPVEKPDISDQNTKSKVGKKLDSNLLDNWNDAEGYYRIIPGELLDGKYLVTSTLGKGMFASVVRATDTSIQPTDGDNEALVAIKIIRNNETMFKAGLKELSTIQKLHELDPSNKQHVVKLIGSFDHKDHLCIVFENLNSNLRDLLKKFGREVGLNIQAIKSYARQLLLGLSLLKDAKIIHADLKPDNILVNGKHNVVKIADLGSACDITENNEITPYLVSRFYRAPELILGLEYSFGIDMWAIACTLYELYTGKMLFPGKTNNDMLRLIMEARGKFSHKMLKKGKFVNQHFDENFDFKCLDQQQSRPNFDGTGSVPKTIKITGPKPECTIKAKLAGMEGKSGPNAKLLTQFIDLLDQMLILNPEKRISPDNALKHPFCN